ncbi:hypothetical protein [Kamptonema sp. UHCC 0994]|uniref:hypothetical protein n=1 Tax=Kamptonema sp. UHCC 0994 TaxID=3031329 RepID=UPI0023B901BE|nr:hypothetical protein [Kamptonema sp. UHCC 0994]MDF0554849.1 hypothetical protein [Kamptonema sp. UHCC 0994]
MISDYKLSSVKNGIGYFARVVVEAMLFSEKELVINAIGHQINRNECEVNAETHKDWINAAIEGANYTLKHIKQLDEINKYDVKLIKVIGLEADTTEDAVRTAASIATWRAINLNCPEPEPVFDKNWYVVFPVRNQHL